jgi:hypothetical protein
LSITPILRGQKLGPEKEQTKQKPAAPQEDNQPQQQQQQQKASLTQAAQGQNLPYRDAPANIQATHPQQLPSNSNQSVNLMDFDNHEHTISGLQQSLLPSNANPLSQAQHHPQAQQQLPPKQLQQPLQPQQQQAPQPAPNEQHQEMPSLVRRDTDTKSLDEFVDAEES